MGGWYNPHGIYRSEELDGLSVSRFIEAVRAEGYRSYTRKCIKDPLHAHPLFHEADVYREGRPTAIAHSTRDTRAYKGTLPAAEAARAFTVPPFRRFDAEAIETCAAMFKKVVFHHRKLIEGDRGDDATVVDENGDG
jgi:hypothetical protein